MDLSIFGKPQKVSRLAGFGEWQAQKNALIGAFGRVSEREWAGGAWVLDLSSELLESWGF